MALTACTDSPEERLAMAYQAAESKELEPFLKLFTRESQALLRNMRFQGEKTKNPYISDTFSILPKGELEEVLVEGNAAVLKIKTRAGDEIRMFRENGDWHIDVFSLSPLWEPIGAKP